MPCPPHAEVRAGQQFIDQAGNGFLPVGCSGLVESFSLSGCWRQASEVKIDASQQGGLIGIIDRVNSFLLLSGKDEAIAFRNECLSKLSGLSKFKAAGMGPGAFQSFQGSSWNYPIKPLVYGYF